MKVPSVCLRAAATETASRCGSTAGDTPVSRGERAKRKGADGIRQSRARNLLNNVSFTDDPSRQVQD
ncbi:hypothetical protein VTH06DRAFT_7786 [Thermothelomyces fergusii]